MATARSSAAIRECMIGILHRGTESSGPIVDCMMQPRTRDDGLRRRLVGVWERRPDRRQDVPAPRAKPRGRRGVAVAPGNRFRRRAPASSRWPRTRSRRCGRAGHRPGRTCRSTRSSRCRDGLPPWSQRRSTGSSAPSPASRLRRFSPGPAGRPREHGRNEPRLPTTEELPRSPASRQSRPVSGIDRASWEAAECHVVLGLSP